MRRLFWQMSVTLDGFMEGPNHELTDTAQVADRKTYQRFAGYWPSATGPDAERLNQLPKIVVSKTLDAARWNNSRLIRENVAEEVARLMQSPGRDLALFGSADLASTLMRSNLIDEYRVLVTPVILGRGGRMFKDVTRKIRLKLVSAKTWSSGIVAMTYRPTAELAG